MPWVFFQGLVLKRVWFVVRAVQGWAVAPSAAAWGLGPCGFSFVLRWGAQSPFEGSLNSLVSCGLLSGPYPVPSID